MPDQPSTTSAPIETALLAPLLETQEAWRGAGGPLAYPMVEEQVPDRGEPSSRKGYVGV
jgi:hypothetical protein